MNQKILVTGGAGYVGSALVKELVERGYKVRVVDKLIFGEKPISFLKNKIELIKADIRKVNSNILKGVDAIIHLAGISTEPTAQFDPRLTDLINHIATERLAKLAKKKGIKRFIFASSCSIYFTYNTPLFPKPSKETEKVNPISPYSISKRAAEQALLELASDSFHPIIFRKGTIYGLSPKMRYDLVLNSFVKDSFLQRKMTVHCSGQIWRPLIDIKDVIWAYIRALELPVKKIGGKIFNVSEKNWNILELAKEVKKILKKEKGIDPEIQVEPVGITRNYQADNTLFKKTFEYKPQRRLKDAILEIWDHLEKNPKDPLDIIHYNDKWLIPLIEAGKI
jgi:nucleoside-diphosphate-sugar epimerase